jgi:hypothetical protein
LYITTGDKKGQWEKYVILKKLPNEMRGENLLLLWEWAPAIDTKRKKGKFP